MSIEDFKPLVGRTIPDHYVQGQYCMFDRLCPRPIKKLKDCPSEQTAGRDQDG
jgi:hypothetical protein